MTMIKIDGLKIKQLREQQGLTQLYLATAVDVTTDTISRWENKRYPSIKKENGIRLAEALGVELDELLDTSVEENESAKKDGEVTAEAQPAAEKGVLTARKKIWPILILSATLFAVIMAFLFSYFKVSQDISVSGTRYAPSHYIAGQPFPIIIELSGQSETEVAFILKEALPENATILHTIPEHQDKANGKQGLKWITKSQLPTSFSYLVAVDSNGGSEIMFKGTVSFSGGDDLPITGVEKMTAGNHHWADTDKDNIISDKEILTIYDKYSKFDGLEDEIDLIEEIWLGEGYGWNSATQQFDIIE